MCADIKEVKTMNSKGWAKQKDESSPPPAWQCQTTHQSAHKGGNYNSGVDCSLILPIVLILASPNFHLIGLLKDTLQGNHFATTTSWHMGGCEELQCFSKEFYDWYTASHRKVEKVCW
jgi:hypothetical protein